MMNQFQEFEHLTRSIYIFETNFQNLYNYQYRVKSKEVETKIDRYEFSREND